MTGSLSLRAAPSPGHSSGRLVSGCDHAVAAAWPGDGVRVPPGKLSSLLLAIPALDQPVGLLDGRLVHEDGVLRVAGLQRVVLLVLVSCGGGENRQGERTVTGTSVPGHGALALVTEGPKPGRCPPGLSGAGSSTTGRCSQAGSH